MAGINIQLDWTDNGGNEDNFIIQRSLDGVSWTSVGTVGQDVLTFVDKVIEINTSYHYRIVARNLGGDTPSNVITKTIYGLKLNINPTGNRTTTVTKTGALTKWIRPDGSAVEANSVDLTNSDGGVIYGIFDDPAQVAEIDINNLGVVGEFG